MLLRRQTLRRAVTIVECAVIYPATFILLLGLVVGALGIVRYQEVASLSRSGARFGSTHGNQYRKDAGSGTGTPGAGTANLSGGYYWYTVDPTASSGSDTTWAGIIYDNAIRPNLVAINPSSLSVKIGWPAVINQQKADNWPGSEIAVSVSYQWMPEILVVGPITLSSTSVLPITN